jgi:hypothetical protein
MVRQNNTIRYSESQGQTKWSVIYQFPWLQISEEHQHSSHNIYTEDLGQNYGDIGYHACHFNLCGLCESYLIYPLGCILLLSFILSDYFSLFFFSLLHDSIISEGRDLMVTFNLASFCIMSGYGLHTPSAARESLCGNDWT